MHGPFDNALIFFAVESSEQRAEQAEGDAAQSMLQLTQGQQRFPDWRRQPPKAVFATGPARGSAGLDSPTSQLLAYFLPPPPRGPLGASPARGLGVSRTSARRSGSATQWGGRGE